LGGGGGGGPPAPPPPPPPLPDGDTVGLELRASSRLCCGRTQVSILCRRGGDEIVGATVVGSRAGEALELTRAVAL